MCFLCQGWRWKNTARNFELMIIGREAIWSLSWLWKAGKGVQEGVVVGVFLEPFDCVGNFSAKECAL